MAPRALREQRLPRGPARQVEDRCPLRQGGLCQIHDGPEAEGWVPLEPDGVIPGTTIPAPGPSATSAGSRRSTTEIAQARAVSQAGGQAPVGTVEHANEKLEAAKNAINDALDKAGKNNSVCQEEARPVRARGSPTPTRYLSLHHRCDRAGAHYARLRRERPRRRERSCSGPTSSRLGAGRGSVSGDETCERAACLAEGCSLSCQSRLKTELCSASDFRCFPAGWS